jgi:hypothetical protein
MTDSTDDLIRLLADMRSGPCRDDIELARDVLDEAADAIRDLRATVQTLSRYRESLSEVIAERDRWKNEALLMAAHQGIDNYQRIMDERDALRERLRYVCSAIRVMGAFKTAPTPSSQHRRSHD